MENLHEHSRQGDNKMNETDIALFMGSVSTELKNGNKFMEGLQGQIAQANTTISQVQREFAVANAQSLLKRENCDSVFTTIATKLTELDGRTARDSVVIKAIQTKVNIGDIVEDTKKTVVKESRDTKVYVMGAVLFLINIATFVVMMIKG